MRSIWKTLYIKKENLKLKKKKILIYTYSRSSIISPNLLNKVILIHNGKKLLKLFITINMLGHKCGEFVLTRGFFKYTKSDKKH